MALAIGRNWIKAQVEKGVEHRFNSEIESLRSDLRKSEDRFKAELTSKEAELAAIRSTVLGGSTNRRALNDKRRLEAVERLWNELSDLDPYKHVAASMAGFKIAIAGKRASKEPKMQALFKMLGTNLDGRQLKLNNAAKEQPFLSSLAYAYFSAYRTVLGVSFALQNALANGIPDADEMLDTDKIRKLMKAALPDYAAFIDEHEPHVYYHLLGIIEDRLLGELKAVLDGKDADKADVQRATEIAVAMKELDLERAKRDGATAT